MLVLTRTWLVVAVAYCWGGWPAGAQQEHLFFEPEYVEYREEEQPGAVEFEADRVEGVAEQRVRLLGNARIIHGEQSIVADEIVLDQAAQTADATGNVRLWYQGDMATCESLHYDVASRQANLFHARMNQRELFMQGEEIIIDASRTVQIYRGDVTTCDLPHPHYHLKTRDLLVIPQRRFYARDTTYNVMGMPVAYLPYYTRSLRERPFAYIAQVGHSGRLGYYMNNKVHYHHSPYINPALYLDAFSRAGVGFGAGNRYRGQGGTENMYGRFLYWNIDQNRIRDDRENHGYRYRGVGYHYSRLPWLDLELTAAYEKLSDNELRHDYDDIFQYAHLWDPNFLSEDRNSFAQLRLPHDDYNVRVLYKERLNDFFHSSLQVDERQPQIHAELRRRRLLDSGLFLHATMDYSRAGLERGHPFGDGRERLLEERFDRADAGVELSHPLTALGWLRVTPYIGGRVTNYSDVDKRVRRWPGDDMVRTDFDDVTRLAGRFGTEFHTRSTYHMGERSDGSGSRLVFEPQVAVEGIAVDNPLALEEPNDPLARERGVAFPFIDEVDTLREGVGRLRYRTDMTYQTRNADRQVRALAGLAVSGAWDFYQEVSSGDEMQDLLTEAYVHPYDWLELFAHHQFDHNENETRSIVGGTTLRYAPWQLWWSTRYSGVRPARGGPMDEDIYMDLGVDIGPKYTFRWTNRWDLDDDKWRDSRAILSRDLHDWMLDFSVRYRDRAHRDDELSFHFRLRFKLPNEPTHSERIPDLYF